MASVVLPTRQREHARKRVTKPCVTVTVYFARFSPLSTYDLSINVMCHKESHPTCLAPPVAHLWLASEAPPPPFHFDLSERRCQKLFVNHIRSLAAHTHTPLPRTPTEAATFYSSSWAIFSVGGAMRSTCCSWGEGEGGSVLANQTPLFLIKIFMSP